MPITPQKGFVLLLSLLILLILSISVSSTVNSLFIDKKIVANQRSQWLAMEAAESSLREAEAWLTAQTIEPIDLNTADQQGCVTEDSAWWKNNATASQTTPDSYYRIEAYDRIEDVLITAQVQDSDSRFFLSYYRNGTQQPQQPSGVAKFLCPPF